MKRLLLVISIFALGLFCIADASANVFAADLKLARIGTSHVLRYRLNEPATEVQIVIQGPLPSTETVQTLPGTTQKGINEIIWDGTVDGGTMFEQEVYDWVVWATDSIGHTGQFDLLSDDDATVSKYYHPCGVASNRNQDNEHFGCLYVTESEGGSVTTRTTTEGVFILNNDLTPFSGQGDSGYLKGTSWLSWFSPMRVRLDEAGNVFLSDFMNSHTGIWKNDPECSGDFLPVLTEEGRDSSGLCTNHGTIMGFWLEGSGKDLELYTLDEDYSVGEETTGSILKYEVGNALQYDITPTVVFDDGANGDLIINSRSQLVRDENGWWIAQYQATQTPSTPWLIHWNGTSVDYNSAIAGLEISSCYGALDIDPEGKRLIVGGFGQIALLDISQGVSSVDLIGEIPAGGDHVQDVGFDAAGNFYQVNTSLKRLRYYSPNDGPNSYSTRCSSSQRFSTEPSTSVPVRQWENYQ